MWWLWLWLGLGCELPLVSLPPDTCDAGDVAWVHRALPLMWGRRPHGTAEVEMWTAATETHGRDRVLRAMAADGAYVDHWQDVLTDTLQVARAGDRAATACYSAPLRSSHDGSLARHIAEAPAMEATPADTPFNMADVIRSALTEDRVDVIWRAHLFAQLHTPVLGANVGADDLERSRRQAFGEAFFETYLHRDLACLPCHNAAYSESAAATIPGLVESALLGNQTGISPDEAYQPFRYTGQASGGVQPWGMGTGCGTLYSPEETTDPLLGDSGYFIEPLGTGGSVWQIERALWVGVEALAVDGYGEDAVAEASFAHLVARRIADTVWEEAKGAPLTLAHHLPRNVAQRDRLWALADTLADSRFSLQDLLAAVALDPYFNAGISCDADPLGMEPVFDPFTASNGPGDGVHRYSARVLIRSAHDALQWPVASRFPAVGDPMQALQADLGARVRDAEPGFQSTDFQSLLAYEAAYGSCARPLNEAAGDGCETTPAVAGCGNCDCEACVCAIAPYCCEVQWDSLCVDMCVDDDCGGCGGQEDSGDAVDRVLGRAAAEGATLAEAAAAIKDRILPSRPLDADGEEGALVAALLDEDLDAPVTDPGALDRGFRLLCGAWLLSADATLALEQPTRIPAPPRLALDVDEDCARLESLLPEMTCPFP
jgi:hypothetical protein